MSSSSITYKKADTTTIGDLTYTYDNAGRRITTGGSLAAVDLPSAVTSPVYNANNQLTSWAGSKFTYDANGNLTSDGTNTFTWNARDQLGSMSGGTSASFSYDGVGRRIGKTIAGTTTAFVYDGRNFVQEKNGTGGGASVTASLITGLTLDEVYTRMTGSNPSAVLAHFLPDANANTIRLLNGSQAVTDSYSYEAYGKTTQTGSSTQSQQYTGRENDGTGLYFYRARYFSPNAARFISEDPIGLNGGANVYAYVGGNPINKRDPEGLDNPGMGPYDPPTPLTHSTYPAPQPMASCVIGVACVGGALGTAALGFPVGSLAGVALGVGIAVKTGICEPAPRPQDPLLKHF